MVRLRHQIGDAAAAAVAGNGNGGGSFAGFPPCRIEGSGKTVSKTFAHAGGQPPAWTLCRAPLYRDPRPGRRSGCWGWG